MYRLLILFIALLFLSCSERNNSYPQRTMPADLEKNAPLVAQAKQLFLSRCADCHGKLSEGRMDRADFFEPPAPDFTSSTYSQMDPAYLFWRISEGKTVEPYLSKGSVMPAWGAHFSDKEIWGLVAYIMNRSRP